MTTTVQQEIHTILIILVRDGDPVGSGYVASMAQLGKNITGFAVLENATAGKWVEKRPIATAIAYNLMGSAILR